MAAIRGEFVIDELCATDLEVDPDSCLESVGISSCKVLKLSDPGHEAVDERRRPNTSRSWSAASVSLCRQLGSVSTYSSRSEAGDGATIFAHNS